MKYEPKPNVYTVHDARNRASVSRRASVGMSLICTVYSNVLEDVERNPFFIYICVDEVASLFLFREKLPSE